MFNHNLCAHQTLMMV